MAILTWDQTGQRLYETGVDHGVLYLINGGIYDVGYAWNGLTTVTESPSGAEPTSIYADNIKYLNLISLEEFGGTIEAFTYPDQFAQCDGSTIVSGGVALGQQARRPFGLSYRTRLGNDTLLDAYGYKLHLIYGAVASPSEKAYATINDSPEAITFSWTFSTVPTNVTGYRPTASIVVDSTKVAVANLTTLENALYGTAGSNPRLPLPTEVVTMFAGAQTVVTPTTPTFVPTTGVITIPVVVGVTYLRADTNAVVTGNVTIAGTIGASLIIRAVPASGTYTFPTTVDTDWQFVRTA